jgi:hypothetical protein
MFDYTAQAELFTSDNSVVDIYIKFFDKHKKIKVYEAKRVEFITQFIINEIQKQLNELYETRRNQLMYRKATRLANTSQDLHQVKYVLTCFSTGKYEDIQTYFNYFQRVMNFMKPIFTEILKGKSHQKTYAKYLELKFLSTCQEQILAVYNLPK